MVVLPWDCVVPGVPASVQSSARKQSDWRARVNSAAAARWPTGTAPLSRPVAVTVAFMHQGQPIDVDNMLKYTLDGLKGVAYTDDSLVEQVVGIRHDLGQALRLDRLSPVLLTAVIDSLADGGPFVYLQLSQPLTLEELLQ